MISCLIAVIIYAILAAIVCWVVELLINMFISPPPQIIVLIRVLFGLIVLLAALSCLGIVDGAVFPRRL